MGKIKAFLSSNSFLFICLGILGVLGAGAVVYASAPVAEKPSVGAPGGASSSPRAEVSGAVSSRPEDSSQVPEDPGGGKTGGGNTAGAAEEDYRADISVILEEAYGNAASGWTGAEQEQARQQLLSELAAQMGQLEQELIQIEAEKQALFAARDSAILELENLIAQAEADLIQATVDLRIAEQAAPQKLAVGENPTIAINEAKARQQSATAQGDEARGAIETTRQDCEATAQALDRRAATLSGQMAELQNQMDAL